MPRELSDEDREFLDMTIYFAEEKGDVTRYTDFNEARFQRLAPTLHAAWKSLQLAEETFNRLLRDHKDNDLG